MREFGGGNITVYVRPDSEDSFPCVHNSLILSLHKPVARVLNEPYSQQTSAD
jgi:hypothetical protein